MPAGDRSGPYGNGPRTGRGLGYCTGGDRPGWDAGGYGGFGRGRGGGRGRGWRHRNRAPVPGAYVPPARRSAPAPDASEWDAIHAELDALRRRLDELDARE